MKLRLLSLIVVLLAVSGTAYAQSGLNFGIRGGASLATLAGDALDEINENRRLGLVAGPFLSYPLTSDLSVQPEVLYAMKGVEFSETDNGETFEGAYKLDYVEVPVLLRYGFAAGPTLLPYVIAGPSVAFNISAKSTFESNGESESEDVKDDVETTDVGVVFGGGLEMMSGVSLDVRYVLGLQNLVKDAEEDEEELRNRAFYITLAFTFPR